MANLTSDFFSVLRDPERTRNLWFQERLGGFEVPKEGRAPNTVSIPELKVIYECFLFVIIFNSLPI